jgi:hypothetical protein
MMTDNIFSMLEGFFFLFLSPGLLPCTAQTEKGRPKGEQESGGVGGRGTEPVAKSKLKLNSDMKRNLLLTPSNPHTCSKNSKLEY